MRCQVCDITCTGPVSFQQHEASEKHKKKVQLQQNITGGASQETFPGKNESLMSTLVEMHCQVCDITCTGPVSFQQHEASERHKKKVQLHQNITGGASQETFPDKNELLIIPCSVCEIQLTGILNFCTHVNSLQHADMVRKKSDGNIVPNEQSGDTLTEPEIKTVINETTEEHRSNEITNEPEIKTVTNETTEELLRNEITETPKEPVNQINPGPNIPLFTPNPIFGFYKHCEVCQKQFSGPEPYQQHLASAGHKKKCFQNEHIIARKLKDASNEPAIAEDKINLGLYIPLFTTKPILGAYEDCKICQKQFSGPEPYQQHLASAVHKKKYNQMQLIAQKNQLKSAANEMAISESKEETDPAPIVSFNLPNETLGSFTECEICQKTFSGPVPFQQHLAGELHMKTVIQKDISSSLYGNVDGDKIMSFASQEKVFAECKSCNMRFSGRKPYQLHIESAGHQKKSAIEQRSSIQVLENINGVASEWKCSVCAKAFTGPIPYNDHMESMKHKKMLKNVEILKRYKTDPEPDSSTTDVKITAEASGINDEWHCEVCKVQMKGADLYHQHIISESHCKNNNSQSGISKEDKFNSDLCKGDKAKDFHINNDLILRNTLKDIEPVNLEDILGDVKVFQMNEEVVYD